jgi:hypothetical protein
MNISNYNEQTLTEELIKRLKDIDSRERIVIKLPFGHSVNRVEIYCSETSTDKGGFDGFFGKKFNYVVTLQQFNDYTNKAACKSSYSYETELLNYIPTLCKKLFASIQN